MLWFPTLPSDSTWILARWTSAWQMCLVEAVSGIPVVHIFHSWILCFCNVLHVLEEYFCQDVSLALEVIKHGLAIQAFFWPLEWRKQKLLLLPPCLHFCPYFLKYILHQCFCPTSNEAIVCQKLACGLSALTACTRVLKLSSSIKLSWHFLTP